MNGRPVPAYWLGRRAYDGIWQAMRSWAADRSVCSAPEQWWFLEHEPVYTLGQSGRTSGLLATGEVPVVESDRGGDITYHGPGQLIFYPLTDLAAAGVGVKAMVDRLEQAVIDLLSGWAIEAQRRHGAPGVYVAGRKVAALGLRVRRGRCYHGLSLNVNLDLTPFAGIHACGYPGLETTRLADLGRPDDTPRAIAPLLAARFAALAGRETVWSDVPDALTAALA